MPSDQEQNEVEMDEPVEESKKGGKSPAVKESKGRGRPRKNPAPSKPDEKSGEPAVKRGRGRPPKAGKASKTKNTEEDAGNGEVDAEKAPAKRRGRTAKAAKEPEPEPEIESEQEEDAGSNEDAELELAPAPPAKTKGAKRGRKATKNGHANGNEKEDEAVEEEKSEKSDAASSDSRIKVVVEHCKSCQTYRRKAEDIITALKEKWSNIDVEYNPKPRKGSFEINLVGHNGSDVKLWTGLELGPPRKLKFPEPEVVVEAMEKVYVPESM